MSEDNSDLRSILSAERIQRIKLDPKDVLLESWKDILESPTLRKMRERIAPKEYGSVFLKNQVVLLAEERILQTPILPKAFVKVQFE